MFKLITSIIICLLLLVVYPCFAQQEGQAKAKAKSDNIDEAALSAIINELAEKLKSDGVGTRNSATEKLISLLSNLIGEVAAEARTEDLEKKKALMKILEVAYKSSKAQLFLLNMDADSRAKVEELSKSLPGLYDRIADSHWKNRQKLVEELTQKGDPRSVPILSGFLNDDNLQVRKYAVKGLGDIGDPGEPSATKALIEMYKSLPAEIYRPETRLLTEETRNLGELVVNALGQLKAKEATPVFVKVLKSGGYSPDKKAIMKALGEIKDYRAMPALVDMLNDKNFFFSTTRGGKRYTLNNCDLALEALLKISDQARADYGMMEYARDMFGGDMELLFESDEARNEAISKFKTWWEQNSDKFISEETAQAFEQEVEAQEVTTLSMSPMMGGPFNQLRTYAQQGKLDQLLEEAEKALRNPFQGNMVIYELTQGFQQHNRLDELQNHFQEKLKKSPTDVSAYKVLGQIYMRQRGQAKATEMYEKAAILAPNDSEVQSDLGNLYHSQGMHQKAIEAYRKAIDLEPGRTYLYSPLANAYASLGQAEEALKLVAEFKQKIKSGSFGGNEGFMQTTLGDIYLAAKRYDEAIEAYKKAIELEPRNERHFKDKLAQAYAKAGKAELATQLRQETRESEFKFVGKPAPDFELKDLQGNSVKLSNLKDKVVLLNFWATWCGPCREEIPHLEKLYQSYKDKGLVILGVDNEPEIEGVRQFAKDLKLSYPILINGQQVFQSYEVNGIPANFYLDRSGVTRSQTVGFGPGMEARMEGIIQALLEGREVPKSQPFAPSFTSDLR